MFGLFGNQIHSIRNETPRQVCVPELHNQGFQRERGTDVDIDEPNMYDRKQ